MKTYSDIVGDGGSDIVGQVGQIVETLSARLSSIRAILAVTSGKGGVGKSSVTVNLAAALAKQGLKIGVLDGDIQGPTIAKMTGVRGQTPKVTPQGIEPATGDLGMKILSMDLFLEGDKTPVAWEASTQQDAFTWRSTLEMTAFREMLHDTVWGELDCLLIDLPPGTDRLPNVAGLLPQNSAALTVTVPSEVSQLVVQRAVEGAKDAMKDRMLGLVDNMVSYVCPHCHEEGPLFPRGKSQEIAESLDIAYLGGIPFDPALAMGSDQGTPLVLSNPTSKAAEAFFLLAQTVSDWLDTIPKEEAKGPEVEKS